MHLIDPNSETQAGMLGCMIGCVGAMVLGAYPIPAVVALCLVLFDAEGHPGEYIYPVLAGCYILIPFVGICLGLSWHRRRRRVKVKGE